MKEPTGNKSGRDLPDAQMMPPMRSAFEPGEVGPTTDAGAEYDPTNPIGSFFVTTLRVLRTPRAFFQGLNPCGGYGRPTGYAIVAFIVTTVLNAFGQMATGYLSDPASAAQLSPPVRLFIGLVFGLVFGAPVGAVITVFVNAAVIHLFVRLLIRPHSAAYVGTYRVVGYSSVAVLLSWIPLVGGVLAAGYAIFLIALGVQALHRSSAIRAAAAVLLASAVELLAGLALLAAVRLF